MLKPFSNEKTLQLEYDKHAQVCVCVCVLIGQSDEDKADSIYWCYFELGSNKDDNETIASTRYYKNTTSHLACHSHTYIVTHRNDWAELRIIHIYDDSSFIQLDFP